METEDEMIQNSCSFRNIEKKKKPTITGKIVDVLPLIKKSRMQARSILIFHCIDVSPNESNSLIKFKIIFFAESAEKIWSLKLGINDYVAIRKAVPIHDYAYGNSDLFYPKLLVVKSLSQYTKHVFFRRNKGEWTLPDCVSLESNEETEHPGTNTKSTTEITEELVSSSNSVNSPIRNEANDSDIEFISTTDWLMARKTIASSQAPSNEPDHGTAETSNSGQLNKDHPISPSKRTNSQKPKSPFKEAQSPESLMHGIVRTYQHKINDKNSTSQLKCVYTKLADVEENMVVNVVAVVHSVLDTNIKTATNKFCELIYVIDDSSPDGFSIRLFYNSEEDRPVLQTHFLILCQDMKISKMGNEIYGAIFSSRQIVTFDKDDPKIYYKNSSDFIITPEDEGRIERLRNWMFENIPMARPFTPLASIASKNETVNLRCQIVDKRDYDKNIIVLRVSDGTTCEVPFYRIPFECDSWQSALSEMKSYREPSKEIDIIVQVRLDHVYRKFKVELKAGFSVELFNVSLKLVPDPVKTKPGHSLKAYLEGDVHNIKITRNKKDQLPRINRSNQPSVPKVSENKSKKTISRLANKRRLFEHSPRNETSNSDDSDFEKNLNLAVVSSKKSKSTMNSNQVAESNDPKSVDPTTSSTSSTGAKNSDTDAIQDVLSKDNPLPNSAISNDKEPEIVLLPDTNSAVIQNSQSSEVQNVNSTNSQSDSVSLARNAKEKATSMLVREHLHQSVKSTTASKRKAIQKKLTDYSTKNDVSNYLVKWPSDPGDEAFYIQVTILSTIPFINEFSSDFDLMALISGYCNRCDCFFPFYLAKWMVSEDDGPISICPKCKEQDVMSSLKHELVCELLLSDDFGNSVPGIVMGHHAENFFGCTVSQLCLTLNAKIHLRTFIDSHVLVNGKEKKPLIMKVIRIYSQQHQVYKYHILT